MSKRIIALLLALVMVFALCACGNGGNGGNSAGTEDVGDETYTIRIACENSDSYPATLGLYQMEKYVESHTNGKGMQKQAAFWMMMSLRPDILVLDEPVDGLDPVMRRQIWSIVMSDVAENGTSVLISSHNLRELEDVCDHVGIMNRGKIMIERTLSDLQEGIVKMQLALPDGETLPDGLDILHASSTGRLQTLILHGTSAELESKLALCNPLFIDFVPLTLEEIFIYELGGADYEVKDIVL